MPEYPAVTVGYAIAYCTYRWHFVFWAASVTWLNGQWTLRILAIISDFEIGSAGGIPGTLFEVLIWHGCF